MSSSKDPYGEPAPKQYGVLLGLYDKPAHRDWLVWWSLAWALIANFSIVFPTEPRRTTMPVWLNAILSAVTIYAVLGFIPAQVRRQMRRRRIRRARAERLLGRSTSHETAAFPPNEPGSTPTTPPRGSEAASDAQPPTAPPPASSTGPGPHITVCKSTTARVGVAAIDAARDIRSRV